MNCPFCKSPARTDWGYHCGTSQDATPQRTNRCREAEVSVLKERIKRLEEVGDAMCAAAAFMGWHLEIEKWNKAKDAKP